MRHRAILTEAQAREIFVQRGRVASAELGEMFDISPKAVRDIWNGRLVCCCCVCVCGRALKEEGCRTWSAVNVRAQQGSRGLKKGSGGPSRALKKGGVGFKKRGMECNCALPAMDYKHALMEAFDFYQEEEEEEQASVEEDANSLFEDLVNEAE